MKTASPAPVASPTSSREAIEPRFERNLGDSLDTAEQIFLEQVSACAGPDDLAGPSQRELVENFAEMWRWATEKAARFPRVRIRHDPAAGRTGSVLEIRSEERRVGKESVSTCRSRWALSH